MITAILLNVLFIYISFGGILIYNKMKDKKAEETIDFKSLEEDENKELEKEFIMRQMENLNNKLTDILEENVEIRKELNMKKEENKDLKQQVKEKTFTEDDDKLIREQHERVKDIRERIKSYKEIDEALEDEVIVDMNELERQKFNNYLARMELVKFRNSLSIENIERNMEIVIGRMVDQFFRANYYNNPAFMQSNGKYTPPFINESRRRIDMFAIYANFQHDVSEDFLEELALIYKYDVVSSESFIVRNYIAPIYNRAMRAYKKAYKRYLENESEAYFRLMEARKTNPGWNKSYTKDHNGMMTDLDGMYPKNEKREAMREYFEELKKRNGTLNR